MRSIACILGLPSVILALDLGHVGISMSAQFARSLNQPWQAANPFPRTVGDSAAGCPYVPPTSNLSLEPTLPAPIQQALPQIDAALVSGVSPSLGVPGCVVQIAYRGEPILTKGYGHINASDASPIPDPEHGLTRIGSVSKLLPTLLMHAMATKGLLDPDEPVEAKVPEFKYRNRFSGQVKPTWRMLAEQRSGLQREPPLETTTERVLDELGERLLVWPPGTRPSYSNLGFDLLGHLLAERVLDPPTTVEQAVRKMVLDPAGLDSTGFDYSRPGVKARLIPGNQGGQEVPFADLGWGFPAGSAYSSMPDLTRMAWALMQRAKGDTGPMDGVLSVAEARRLLDVDFWNPDGLTLMGAPWEVEVQGPLLVKRKGGNIPGYATLFAMVPQLDTTVMIGWNAAQNEFGTVPDAVYEALLPAINRSLIEAQPPSPVDPSPHPGDYTGQYSAPGGIVLNVTLQGGPARNASALLFSAAGPGFEANFPLNWLGESAGGDAFGVWLPSNIYGCLDAELEALQGQIVQFHRSNEEGGKVFGVDLLGWIPGLRFTRPVQ